MKPFFDGEYKMRKKIINLVEITAFATALIISAGVFHKNTEKEILSFKSIEK